MEEAKFPATFGEKNIIAASADGARSVFAIDLDGDDDVDVLSASSNDNVVAWYENDGAQSFTKRVISTSADGVFSVYAIDLDGDGDVDVLSASSESDAVAWYENNGERAFTKHTITTGSWCQNGKLSNDGKICCASHCSVCTGSTCYTCECCRRSIEGQWGDCNANARFCADESDAVCQVPQGPKKLLSWPFLRSLLSPLTPSIP